MDFPSMGGGIPHHPALFVLELFRNDCAFHLNGKAKVT